MIAAATAQVLSALRGRLLRQSVYYTFGQVLQRAIAFLLIPLWTAFLAPEDYGITGTLNAYGQISNVLLTFGIYGAVMRSYFDFKDDPDAKKSYIFSNFLFLAITSGCAIGVCIILGRPYWDRLTAGGIPFQPYAVLTLVSVFGGVVYRFLYSLWQAKQHVKTCVSAELAIFLVATGISLPFVAIWHKGAYGVVVGSAAAQILAGLIAAVILFRQWFSKQVHWSHVKASLAFGLPLVPHLLSHWVLNFADRVMLTKYVPLHEVGLYNLGYNLGMIMLVVVTGINEAFQPYYFDLMSSNSEPHRKVIRIVSTYIVGAGLLALFGSIFADELIALLTPSRYQGSAKYVPPVILGYLFVGLYFFTSSPLFYHKQTKLLPLITAVGASLNIVLNLALIPRYGAIASAWNTLVSYVFLLIMYYLAAQRIERIAYPIWRYALLLAALIISVQVTRFIPSLTVFGVLLKVAVCAMYLFSAYLMLLRLRSTSVTGDNPQCVNPLPAGFRDCS